jgi:L-threonate 2-dehydrogenase
LQNPAMTAKAIGIIGIGNMGGAMALRLLDRGHSVHVRDIDPAREAVAQQHGAIVSPAPAALAACCELVIVAVVDAAQTEAVLFGGCGAAAALPRGGCVMLCPTIGPASTEAIAARLSERGIDCIDAPMSGGPARARDGSMSLMVACAEAVLEAHRPVLDSLSTQVFHVGTRPGDGARTKLVNNLLAAINLAGAAEALALAERVGLDPGRTLDVIERSSGQSWIGSDRLRRAIAGDLAPRAHTTLLAKDSRLALDMAAAQAFATPIGAEAAEAFARACRLGLAELDDASLLSLMRGLPAQGEGPNLPKAPC